MRVACFYYDCGAGFKHDALKDASFFMTSYALGGVKPQEQMGKSKKKKTPSAGVLYLRSALIFRKSRRLRDYMA